MTRTRLSASPRIIRASGAGCSRLGRSSTLAFPARRVPRLNFQKARKTKMADEHLTQAIDTYLRTRRPRPVVALDAAEYSPGPTHKILSKHGWKLAGGSPGEGHYTHPDHPGSQVHAGKSFSRNVAWSHQKEH